MLNRDDIAHEYMLKQGSITVKQAFDLADAMIAEAEKRTDKERPAILGDGWISVWDKLPADGYQVLIYSKETSITSACYRKAVPDIGLDCDDWSGWFSDEVPTPDVTHWQPLPQAPK